MSGLSIPITCILLAMFSIQFGASVAKKLFPIVGASGATGLRLFFAALLLLLIWRPWRKKFSTASMKTIFYYGATLGFMNLLFYWSLERIPLGIAVALEFVGPLGIALVQSRKAYDFIWALLAAIGIYLLLPVSGVDASRLDFLGIILALGAGGCWALYIFFGNRASQIADAGIITSIGMFVAALVVTPFVIVQTNWASLDSSNIRTGFFIAILSSAIPYSLEMVALKKIPTKTFGILMSLEPATAALMGFLNLNETLAPSQLFAMSCIIIASIGTTLTSSRRNENETEKMPQKIS